MAPSFMSFPVEIRLLIYQYLLHSWKFHIALHYSQRRRGGKLLGSVTHRGEGAGLQPAILRCSRQIYTEAITVLYSENYFEYYSNDRYAPHAGGFPLHNLTLIRYLGVCIYENEMPDDGLQYIADATLALRRGVGLLLHFSSCISMNSCCFDKHRNKPTARPLAIRVASSSMILEGILELDVRQELEIVVLDNKASTREIFQNLASATAVAKNWNSIDENGFFQDKWFEAYGPEGFRCSWILRPTPSAPPSAVAHFLCRNMWKGFAQRRAEAEAAQSTS